MNKIENWTDLIGKPNSTTKWDPANDEHGKVLSCTIENCPDYKEHASDEHRRPSPKLSGCVGSRERRR